MILRVKQHAYTGTPGDVLLRFDALNLEPRQMVLIPAAEGVQTLTFELTESVLVPSRTVLGEAPHTPPGELDVESGVEIIVRETASRATAMLVREGCSGSPRCALELYVATGDDYLGDSTVNVHMADAELETLYKAVKAIRKARRATR